MSRILVIAGVLVEHGRMLLTQRQPGVDFADCWECPGGKQEPGEDHETTLKREWLEGLDVRLGPLIRTHLFADDFDPPTVGKACRVIHYPVHRVSLGAPKLLGCVGAGWFTVEELKVLRGTAALNLRRGQLISFLQTNR